MKKQRVVVICPGRGSYTKSELGYLNFPSPELAQAIKYMDEQKSVLGEMTISELDGADVFKGSIHTKGHNASALIYACSLADFLKINREKYDIVAVTGNSMGWYSALAFGQALDHQGAFKVINTMGSMMKEQLIGGQIIYPVVDQEWRIEPSKTNLVMMALEKVNSQTGSEVYISIRLGGYYVLAGNRQGLNKLMELLPKEGDYPFQLINHGAFHTPMLQEVSESAFKTLSPKLFHKPTIPMIDGRGVIWTPYGTDVDELYGYTLGHQVTEMYDFSCAVTVALKEFAPDKVILLGPGNSLGGAMGQILIQNLWRNINNKNAFTACQEQEPFLVSMGIAEQQKLVI